MSYRALIRAVAALCLVGCQSASHSPAAQFWFQVHGAKETEYLKALDAFAETRAYHRMTPDQYPEPLHGRQYLYAQYSKSTNLLFFADTAFSKDCVSVATYAYKARLQPEAKMLGTELRQHLQAAFGSRLRLYSDQQCRNAL